MAIMFIPPENKRCANARAWVPGSAGEFVQGVLDGEHRLVSCPIDHRVCAEIFLPGRGPATAPPSLCYTKTRQALAMLLAADDPAPETIDFRIRNRLPRGIGMASSTADIVAVTAALQAALGRSVHAPQLARLAAAIEPSDSIMFEGLALINPRNGELIRRLGQPPPMRVLLLDPGGRVDTLGFNLRRDASGHNISASSTEAIGLLAAGVADRDLAAIGRAASLSARAQQVFLRHHLLETAEDLARKVGAFGVNVAHSGTLVGLLLPDDPERAHYAGQRARRLRGLKRLRCYQVIGGGFRIETDQTG